MVDSKPLSTAVLIDLDGVVYQDGAVIPGANEVIDWIRQRGLPHLFVTNTSSRGREAIAVSLKNYGIECNPEQIFTPIVAAREWMKARELTRIALFVTERSRSEFDEFDVLEQDAQSGADAVVIGDLGEGWDFQRLNQAFRHLMQDPPPVLIALGMTRYWQSPDGLQLDVAPFIKALEHASDCVAEVVGKPSAAFFEMALSRLDAAPSGAIMVGDDINSDVRGAQRCGITGVLVKTGKFRPADLQKGPAPDAVLDSFADLPGWLSPD